MKSLKKACRFIARVLWFPIAILVIPLMPDYIVTIGNAIDEFLYPEKRRLKPRPSSRPK